MVSMEAAAAAAEAALAAMARPDVTLDEPDGSYSTLGSVSAGLVSLRQALDQLALWHDRAAGRAADDDSEPRSGYRHAIMAAARLRHATALVQRASVEIDAAWAENGHIVWQPAPHPPAATIHRKPDEPTELARRLPPTSAFGASAGHEEAGGRGHRQDGLAR
ncbi:hypothetical protein [Jiangella muralis]|uniref:hypothetical protein n=1 Tax=Jiangella muralis TaxID=702383 RepID=UPI00069D9255|nr:hypothetical protein [Jiangella muralis]